MDKVQKFDYIQTIENYLEDNTNPSSDSQYFTHVYELFLHLQKQLLIHRPENPIDFLIKKLGKKPSTKIFVVGPPGSQSKMIASQISDHFQFEKVSTGVLLNQEKEKSSELGKRIKEQIENYRFVDDSTTIDLVKAQIPNGNDDDSSYVVEGFPKNKVQALSLQKIGIIPDKFILLSVDEETQRAKIRETLSRDGQFVDEQTVDRAVLEYQMNIKGLREQYQGPGQFLYEVEVKVDNMLDTIDDIKRMVQIKLNSPKRPPRIIILGPPGSGRATQARTLAQKYGLVHVSTMQLLRDEITRKTERGQIISSCISKGEMVPDETIMSIVETRLR